MKVIKWTNKYSNETGFVKCLGEGHFINTWEQDSAMKFRNQAEADKTLDTLYEFGEDANNNFDVIDIPEPEKTKPAAKETAAKKTAEKKPAAGKKSSKKSGK